MEEKDFKSLRFTVLGKDCEYEGDIRLRGDAIVNCKLTGTITMLDGDSKLTIERSAEVEGSIYCQDAEIFGEVKGSISAAGSLVVRSSAKVSGKVSAAGLSVYPGAVLNIEGSAERKDPAQA